MTPDRPDQTPDEDQHGVLSDTGSIETTGLGILGGATEQVSVEFPVASEDDFVDDDDVTGDEIPLAAQALGEAEVPAETAEGEIVETPGAGEEWTDDAQAAEAPAGVADDVEDADVIVDDEYPGDNPDHDQPGAHPADSSSPLFRPLCNSSRS